MARLRSEKWYSSDGQRRSRKTVTTRTNGSRRLLSLSFLLALVVMLMFKAADPKHVRNAFNALGVPLDAPAVEQPGKLAGARPLAQATPATPLTESQKIWRATCQDLSNRIASSLTGTRLNTLAQQWFASAPSSDAPPDWQAIVLHTRSLIAEQQTRLAGVQTDPNAAAPNGDQWLAALRQFDQLWTEFSTKRSRTIAQADTPETGEDHLRTRGPDKDFVGSEESGSFSKQVFNESLSNQLDAALVAGLADAAFWKPHETTTFFRLLERAEQGITAGQHAKAPEINTLQLESESATLRGKLVRYRGEIHQIESSSGVDPISGEETLFYKLWLRGVDRANQPVAIYLTPALAEQLPKLPQVGKSLKLSEPKRCSLSGLCGKRMAYRAEGGIEVAPSLFATHIQTFASDTLSPVQDDPDAGWKFAQIGLAAAAVSLLITWLVRPGSTGTRLVRRKSLVIAVCVLPHLSSLAQETPPWAATNSVDTLRSILQQPIEDAWKQDTYANLMLHASSASATLFPDGVLKTVRLLNQVGWKRATELERLSSSWIAMDKVQIRGVVTQAEPVALTTTQLQWFGPDDTARLFRLKIQYRAGELQSERAEPLNAVVYCTRVPLMWLGVTELRQPATIEGFELAPSSPEPNSRLDEKNVTCFLAEAPQWTLSPSTKPAALNPLLSDRMLALGNCGWNLTHLDCVAANNQQALSQDEAAAYYTLMRSIASPLGRKLATTSRSETQPTDVLNSNRPQTGLPLNWSVRLVSGTVVEVPKVDQGLLGSPRYFQMNGFVDIGNRKLSYLATTDSGETRAVNFEREFPVILVTTDAKMVPENVADGTKTSWDVGRHVKACGVFYRLWAYRSDLIESRGASSLQAAPLMVVTDLEDSLPPIRDRGSPIGWFGVALSLVIVCLIGLVLYFAVQNLHRRRLSS